MLFYLFTGLGVDVSGFLLSRSRPSEVHPFTREGNIKVVSVCCGSYHSMVLDSEGGVWTWGARSILSISFSLFITLVLYFVCSLYVPMHLSNLSMYPPNHLSKIWIRLMILNMLSNEITRWTETKSNICIIHIIEYSIIANSYIFYNTFNIEIRIQFFELSWISHILIVLC